ncbi:MAG: site-specific integrase, partial [Butyricicoccus sp.]|nr:site-specific integrase [Butyricicoccus sp.]
PLVSITNADITRLINELKKKGYQYETKNKVKVMLVDMFSRALLNKLASDNPAKSVRVFKDKRVERRVLTQEEQTDFFDTCRGTFYDELFTVAILTGLRPGELCALRWRDIDLKHKCLRVERTLIYQKFEGEERKTFHAGPPKTQESRRTVYFNDRCATALKKQFSKRSMISLRPAYDPLSGFEDLLFVTKFGTPINASIYGSAIERIIDLINENRCEGIDTFEKFSPHCFRHTYATRCFEANVAPKIVQEQLGHASLKMTMDLYTHVTETKRAEELEKFSALSENTFEAADEVAEYRFKRQQKVRSIG